MTTKHSWWVPVGSFALAVAISLTMGPATAKLLARDPAGATGDCTPVVPAAGAKKKADCDKFKKSTTNFNPAAPPEGMPALKPGEDALTECEMTLSWDGDFDIYTCTNQDGSCVAVAKASRIDATFGGEARIWLPNGAPALLVAHEEGHASICEAACDAGCQKLKKDIANCPETSAPQKSADCTTAAGLAEAAVKTLIQTFLDGKLKDFEDKEQTASDDYDTATDHGKKGDQKKEAQKASTAVKNAIAGN